MTLNNWSISDQNGVMMVNELLIDLLITPLPLNSDGWIFLLLLVLVSVLLPSDLDLDLISGGPPCPLQNSGHRTLSNLLLVLVSEDWSETTPAVISGPAVDLDLTWIGADRQISRLFRTETETLSECISNWLQRWILWSWSVWPGSVSTGPAGSQWILYQSGLWRSNPEPVQTLWAPQDGLKSVSWSSWSGPLWPRVCRTGSHLQTGIQIQLQI